MKNLSFFLSFLILFLSFFSKNLFAEPDFSKIRVTQSQLADLIDDWHAQGRDRRLKKMMRVYPEAFRGLDLSQAYFEVGMRYYRQANRLTALRFFLSGFSGFSESEYKYRCAYRAAKVLYHRQNRESALYYVNRVLEYSDGELHREALRLKKRIRWEYFSRFEGLPDDSISHIEFDGDDVWISMWTGGIIRFTRSSGLVRVFRAKKGGLISDHVRSISVTSKRVWVGTYNGLCFYDKKKGEWSRRIPDLGNYPVKQLFRSGEDFYAGVLRRGLYRYSSHSDRWKKIFDRSLDVSAIAQAAQTLFVGTLDKGLFEIKGKKIRLIVPKLAVKSVAVGDGKLWIGSYGRGLWVWNIRKDRIEKVYRKSNGFSSDYIESLLFVPGKLLVGTLGGGVMVLDRAYPDHMKKITVLDGLPSPDVVEMQREGSRIWFGTLSGGIGILLTEDFQDF